MDARNRFAGVASHEACQIVHHLEGWKAGNEFGPSFNRLCRDFRCPRPHVVLAEDLADEKTQTVMKDFRQFVDDPEYLITELVV